MDFLVALVAVLKVFLPLPNFFDPEALGEWVKRVGPAVIEFVNQFGGWDNVVSLAYNVSFDDVCSAEKEKCCSPAGGFFKGDGSFLKALLEIFLKLAPLFFTFEDKPDPAPVPDTGPVE